MHHLLRSSMRQASFKCETPGLELKSSRSFLAIKGCQQTKSKKVIKRSRSSSKSWAHVMTVRNRNVHFAIWRDLFFTTGQTVFFSEPRQEKQRTTIRHTEPGRYDGRQRLWLFLLPVGHPRPFQSMVRVDRVVGDSAYKRLHRNRSGGCQKNNNQPQKWWRRLWAPPVMASAAAYRPFAAVPLERAR